MPDISFEQLLWIFGVVIVFMGAYNTIMTSIKNHREEKKLRNSPITEITQKLSAHDEMLARDKRELEQLKKSMDERETESRLILRSLKATMSHLINGNDIEKLRGSMSEIDEYLIDR